MPKHHRSLLVQLGAALAGAGLAYVIARQVRRHAQTHTVQALTARDEYTSAFPVRRRFASIAGCRTHLYEAGESHADQPPLLLIHGGVVEGASWLESLSALAADRRVLAPDLPAHGASGYLPPSQLLNWLDTLVASEFGAAGRPFDLCGHSMGGGLSIHYAARHGARVRRLILCAPVGTGQRFPRVWPEPWSTGRVRLFPLPDALIEKVWGDPLQITRTQRWQFSLLFRDFFFSRRWWWYLSGGLQWLFDLPLPLLAAIRTPTLFVWAERDRIVPFHRQRTPRYVQAVPGARLQFLNALGHLPQVESPAEFTRVIHEFLAH